MPESRGPRMYGLMHRTSSAINTGATPVDRFKELILLSSDSLGALMGFGPPRQRLELSTP